jgi:hypothetical protein
MALKMKTRSKKQKAKMRKTKRFKGGFMSFIGKKPDEKVSNTQPVAPEHVETVEPPADPSADKQPVAPSKKETVISHLKEVISMIENSNL